MRLPAPLTRRAAGALPGPVLARLADRLAASPAVERRLAGAAMADALETGDARSARRIAVTVARRPDLRAEKIVSRRYRFVWTAVPKAASRSMIAALMSADPGAELIRGRTLDEILARRPEVRDWFRFAFVRHPAGRARSFWADKHGRALRDRKARRYFIDPYCGLRPGMSFDAFCRWLETPFGADAFADRHWLSQHLQLRDAEGRLPCFVGRFERLDADWREAMARLRIPHRPLPRLNEGPGPEPGREPGEDAAAAAMLRRRYAGDLRFFGYS